MDQLFRLEERKRGKSENSDHQQGSSGDDCVRWFFYFFTAATFISIRNIKKSKRKEVNREEVRYLFVLSRREKDPRPLHRVWGKVL
jgi:hypothetical protein